jgi:dipeptidyl aminopeptidase/acylaminoacyl peptidase
MLPLGSDGGVGDEPQPLLTTSSNESDLEVSPDGRWMAYSSDESGVGEIYVQPFPDGGERWQISTDGGDDPLWAASGRQLFYLRERSVMVVDVDAEPELHVSAPRVVFERKDRPFPSGTGRDYDVAPDGGSFVVIQTAGAGGSTREQLNVVLNWFEELERLVPPN